MVLDEEALEAMLRRQRAADDDGHSAPPVQMTARTEEFEVYERPKPADEESAPEPDQEPEMEMEIPVFEESVEEEANEAEPEPPAPAPTPEPTPAAPPEAPRRPQVWPPIARSHAPQANAATQGQPTTAQTVQGGPAAAPTAQPPGPLQNPGNPAPRAGSGSGCRIAIVHCRFNHEITDRMLQAARDHAAAAGAEIVAVLSVPGVFDAPLAAQTLARRRDVDGVVVIGAVVTGDTKHDEVITFATAHKLLDIACAEEVPVGLGITGPGQSWAEAEARIGNAAHAVQSVVEQWQLLQTA